MNMARRAARPRVLSEGSFGAFVLDQLSEHGDIAARPMFGGAGFYLDGEFFGILYEERLYFRVSPETIGEYTARKMKPFAPNHGQRSFPRKELSKGIGEWNHYYIRAINGEVRLWVNGEEVSGGTNCDPKTGFLCLESEGAPVEFKNIRIRELP